MPSVVLLQAYGGHLHTNELLRASLVMWTQVLYAPSAGGDGLIMTGYGRFNGFELT